MLGIRSEEYVLGALCLLEAHRSHRDSNKEARHFTFQPILLGGWLEEERHRPPHPHLPTQASSSDLGLSLFVFVCLFIFVFKSVFPFHFIL